MTPPARSSTAWPSSHRTAIDVTIDSEGDTFAMPGIDLTTASYSNAIAGGVGLTSTTFAADALLQGVSMQSVVWRLTVPNSVLSNPA